MERDWEAGEPTGQYLARLSANGSLFAFSRVNPELLGKHSGHDLAASVVVSEWAGVCFSPDGQWLFANIIHPGLTCAITGLWVEGLI